MEPTDETEPQEKTEFDKFQELGKHLFSLPKIDAEALKALNDALAPPQGDVVVSVESHDRALLRELWMLQDKNVKVEELLQKSGTDPGVVWLILRDAETSLKGTLPVLAGVFLKKVIDVVRSFNGGDKKHSKTKIRSRKFSVELKSFVLRYEDSMDIEVEKTEDSKDDASKD
jgi:hypothetical protein